MDVCCAAQKWAQVLKSHWILHRSKLTLFFCAVKIQWQKNKYLQSCKNDTVDSSDIAHTVSGFRKICVDESGGGTQFCSWVAVAHYQILECLQWTWDYSSSGYNLANYQRLCWLKCNFNDNLGQFNDNDNTFVQVQLGDCSRGWKSQTWCRGWAEKSLIHGFHSHNLRTSWGVVLLVAGEGRR